ncbi:MAG: nuclear transport factor 2 family protein [Haliea sp.]|jgi:ketosteroid isomerase-like protein|nr:nuclear transport factor 2 family protein [Haliea sp.]MDP4917044.1 nuclear transport factor 2 family protein [Haliea sp.]
MLNTPFTRLMSNRLLLWIPVILASLCLGLTAQNGFADDSEELANFQREIRVKYDMKEAAFAANDPEPILTQFYHPDAISTGPDGMTHVGREELRSVYEQVIASRVKIESYSSFVRGDAGWDWVNFHVTPPADSGDPPFTFKMLFLWEREDGEWWSQGEMYTIGEFDVR